MLRQACCSRVLLPRWIKYSSGQRSPALSFTLVRHRNTSHTLLFSLRRHLTSEAVTNADTSASKPHNPPPSQSQQPPVDIYHGPLAATFRRLKIFSLSSLGLSFTLSPFMFLIESNLPLAARFALATIAVTTSGVSTALVGWCGRPYVTTLRRLQFPENEGVEGLEMTTLTLGLHPRITRVYDPAFLVETKRPFAKWELAGTAQLPTPKPGAEGKPILQGQEETVAETMDKDGGVIGRWVVKWGDDGQGACREVGQVVRYFNVHEELLR